MTGSAVPQRDEHSRAWFTADGQLDRISSALRGLLTATTHGDSLFAEILLFGDYATAVARLRTRAAGGAPADAAVATQRVPLPDGTYRLRAWRIAGGDRGVVVGVEAEGELHPPGAQGVLTAQERRIASLLAEGLTNSEIGSRLSVSPHTVHTHAKSIFRKLGVRSRAQLAARLYRPRAGDGPAMASEAGS